MKEGQMEHTSKYIPQPPLHKQVHNVWLEEKWSKWMDEFILCGPSPCGLNCRDFCKCAYNGSFQKQKVLWCNRHCSITFCISSLQVKSESTRKHASSGKEPRTMTDQNTPFRSFANLHLQPKSDDGTSWRRAHSSTD